MKKWSIYSFESIFSHGKKEKGESVSFQHIDIRLKLSQRFLETLKENWKCLTIIK